MVNPYSPCDMSISTVMTEVSNQNSVQLSKHYTDAVLGPAGDSRVTKYWFWFLKQLKMKRDNFRRNYMSKSMGDLQDAQRIGLEEMICSGKKDVGKGRQGPDCEVSTVIILHAVF